MLVVRALGVVGGLDDVLYAVLTLPWVESLLETNKQLQHKVSNDYLTPCTP